MKTVIKQRVEWIDAAKALSIMMVTMLHTGQLAQPSGIDVGRIVELNSFLAPIRMPLFFAAAGVFAGSALAKPWGDLLRSKVALYAWLFVIWTFVRWAFCAVVMPNPDNPSEGSNISEVAWAMLMPTTGLWFLWCLGIFFVLSKALLRFDKRIVFGLSVAISIMSLIIADDTVADRGILANLAHRNALRYFAFFYGAAMFPAVVTGLSKWKLAQGIVILAAAFVGCYALYSYVDSPIAAFPRFCASMVGVALLFLCARVLDSYVFTSRLFRYLGYNTLPIYVAQVPLIMLYVACFKALGLNQIGILKNLVVPVGVVLVVIASLGLRRMLIMAGAGFMYRLPRFQFERTARAEA